jgi:hypothetical protein
VYSTFFSALISKIFILKELPSYRSFELSQSLELQGLARKILLNKGLEQLGCKGLAALFRREPSYMLPVFAFPNPQSRLFVTQREFSLWKRSLAEH